MEEENHTYFTVQNDAMEEENFTKIFGNKDKNNKEAFGSGESWGDEEVSDLSSEELIDEAKWRQLDRKKTLSKLQVGPLRMSEEQEQEKDSPEAETINPFDGHDNNGLGVNSGTFLPNGGLSVMGSDMDEDLPPPHLTPKENEGDDLLEETEEAETDDAAKQDDDPGGSGLLSIVGDKMLMPSNLERQLPLALNKGENNEDDDEDDDDEDDDDVQPPAPEGAYDPSEYETLDVAPEIKELFSFITRYTPQAIELEHRLRPYVPDYIPAVGDIDAFIKILPPDSSDTRVGLTVLDEPSARQSDSTVLDLQLRSLARHTTSKAMAVKAVDGAEKNPKVIEKWVRDISDLHRAKPPPTVHYSKRMPDIDSLMQEWPGELEDMLQELRLPNATLDLDLSNFAGLVCAIMDIPVYKSKVQSLHVLFTLYSEFRNSVHFRRLAEENYMDNDEGSGDRLVID